MDLDTIRCEGTGCNTDMPTFSICTVVSSLWLGKGVPKFLDTLVIPEVPHPLAGHNSLQPTNTPYFSHVVNCMEAIADYLSTDCNARKGPELQLWQAMHECCATASSATIIRPLSACPNFKSVGC
jgi:hypothetical protein